MRVGNSLNSHLLCTEITDANSNRTIDGGYKGFINFRDWLEVKIVLLYQFAGANLDIVVNPKIGILKVFLIPPFL
jgi:hypothetical protein